MKLSCKTFIKSLNAVIKIIEEENKPKTNKKTKMLTRWNNIKALLDKGKSQRQIAYLLKIPQPTVCYTIKQYKRGFYD